MPPDYSDTQKEQLFQFVLSVRQAVVDQMPIGLSFYGNTRVVLPHNVFLQNKTPRTSGIFQSRSQERSFTGMLPVKNGTEKCIGMDAYQVFSQKSESRNGWKYFNLHEINNLRLHTLEEVRSIFDLEGDYIWEGANLDTGFDTIRDFVPDWNIFHRKFLSQVHPARDFRSIRSRKNLQRVAE